MVIIPDLIIPDLIIVELNALNVQEKKKQAYEKTTIYESKCTDLYLDFARLNFHFGN